MTDRKRNKDLKDIRTTHDLYDLMEETEDDDATQDNGTGSVQDATTEGAVK